MLRSLFCSNPYVVFHGSNIFTYLITFSAELKLGCNEKVEYVLLQLEMKYLAL